MSYKAYLDFDLSNMNLTISHLIKYFEDSDINLLHRLDEALLEKGILENDKDIINISVVAYCLRKLLSKKHIVTNIKWPEIKQKILVSLDKIKKYISVDDQDSIKEQIKIIETTIEHTDNLFGYFVQNLVSTSRAKIASSVYGYGLSLNKAVNLLSANKEQVMKIIGETKMADEDELKDDNIKKRVDYLLKNKNK